MKRLRLPRRVPLWLYALLAMTGPASHAADLPRGFFVENLRQTPAAPAFYNVETHRLQPFPLKCAYSRFIDFSWDHERSQVFFSARLSPTQPFHIYVKDWPSGEEKPIYENSKGPFRFLLSPDGKRLAIQVFGRSAWPFMGVLEWSTGHWTDLGQGFSPDWSIDGQQLLFLKIPDGLPTWLYEYRVETDSATLLVNEPVMEAAYTDDAMQIVLKTASQAAKRDIFQLWNRRSGTFHDFCPPETASRKHPIYQRELAAFPGHQFFFFKESADVPDPDKQQLIVADVWGRRLQSLSHDDWSPMAMAVEGITLAMSEDPLVVVQADGTGGLIEIPQARFIRLSK